MDFCSLPGTTSSWLLPTIEVVSSQVPQAGSGCCELAATLASFNVLLLRRHSLEIIFFLCNQGFVSVSNWLETVIRNGVTIGVSF